MSVSFQDKDKFLIIAVDGKLDSLNARESLALMEKKLRESDKDVVFNFENLEYISSAGLQILLLCAQNRKKISKDVFIYKPSNMVDNIIKIAGFYSFLKKKKHIDG